MQKGANICLGTQSYFTKLLGFTHQKSNQFQEILRCLLHSKNGKLLNGKTPLPTATNFFFIKVFVIKQSSFFIFKNINSNINLYLTEFINEFIKKSQLKRVKQI